MRQSTLGPVCISKKLFDRFKSKEARPQFLNLMLFFVSWSIAIAENAAATAPLSSPWQKKLIEYGWDSQTPAFTPAGNMYIPRPAPPFRVNLARERPEPNEYSSWAPVAKSLFETGNFGTWKFK